MARFDIYRIADTSDYLLDVQSDFLSYLNTRIVVPLLRPEHAPQAAKHLNPSFEIEGEKVIMVTQFLAAVPKSTLHTSAGHLADHHDEIVRAIDFLMQGF